ncbi:putative aquaporin TIP4-1 [Escovopsis weberi]|uniref:Putative aquaporin TIP4-1 n=1 Tax=Escovopsis weberi TaxID=150374 RepID=A0A0M8N5X2_ESCWE|nr:putative aquaporin TIP4-1 [Escovopsis weberi]
MARTSTVGSSVLDHEQAQAIHPVDVAKFDGSFAPNARPIGPALDVPWYRNREYLLGGWSNTSVWKAAMIEGIGTSCLVFVSGHTTATLLNYGTVQIGAYVGLSNIFLIAVFIYATAAMTGGHLNPMITFSAIFAGICPTLGAALGGGVLLGVYGSERAKLYHGGGCFFDLSEMNIGQVFLNEIFGSFALLFLSYGVGLDPRQALLFGPRFGPVLVGSSLGLITFASSGIIPGYAGAQMNPARCFAYGVAKQDLTYQWVWWFGPAIAALLLAFIYNIAPPHSKEKYKEGAQHTLPS